MVPTVLLPAPVGPIILIYVVSCEKLEESSDIAAYAIILSPLLMSLMLTPNLNMVERNKKTRSLRRIKR